MPGKEYCAVRKTEVKESSRGGVSRNGKAQKPRRAHSRTSCYGTNEASLQSDECVQSESTHRCVRNHKDLEAAERRRSRSRERAAAKRAARKVSRREQAGGNPHKEYCALHEVEVKASKDGLRKSHTRRSCVSTDDAAKQSDECVHSMTTHRCVKNTDNFDKHEAHRAKVREHSSAKRAADKASRRHHDEE
jgi:hypothetical protein